MTASEILPNNTMINILYYFERLSIQSIGLELEYGWFKGAKLLTHVANFHKSDVGIDF